MSFEYTNWRGKNFTIDEHMVSILRKDLIEDGHSEEDINYLTLDYLREELPFLELEERTNQLETMWEQEAKSNPERSECNQ